MMSESWDREAVFDDDYLYFYADRIGPERSDKDAELVWRLCELEPGARVLDLGCGNGRIANRLAARGAEVTGVDATPYFLELAREDAILRRVDVRYVERDFRELDFDAEFDVVVSWFTSFGYFDDASNRRVLESCARALVLGGRVLVELNHGPALIAKMVPWTAIERGPDVMMDEHRWDPYYGRLLSRRVIVRDGGRREMTYFTRLFGFPELRDWLLAAGFTSVGGFAGDGMALTADSMRMIARATRA